MVKKAFIVTIIGIILSATLVQSQAELDSYIEMLRSDLKTEKISIITEVMKFTEEEATAFWPVYREYDLELNKLFDQRIALIKDYAENFDAMTGEKAKDLINTALKIEDKREKELPEAGLFLLKDHETGEEFYVDFSSSQTRKRFQDDLEKTETELLGLFKKYNIDFISIENEDNYEKPLFDFFLARKRKFTR